MKSYQGYLIDLDGTTYYGKTRIPSAENFINGLIKAEMPIQFVTNNATKSLGEIANLLQTYYELPVSEEMITTSTLALIEYLHQHHHDASVYCIGELALKKQLKEAGFKLVNTKQAEVVVQALDREVSYDALSIAIQAILNGASFIVTNTDRLIPTENGMMPSSGALTSFIQYATQVEPLVIGKPFAPIIETAIRRINIPREKLILIGDNYGTDIQAGINAEIDTLLVLTGVTTKEKVTSLPIAPNYVVDDLSQWGTLWHK